MNNANQYNLLKYSQCKKYIIKCKEYKYTNSPFISSVGLVLAFALFPIGVLKADNMQINRSEDIVKHDNNDNSDHNHKGNARKKASNAFMDMSNINTKYDEFAPTVSPDGKFLLFNSKRGRDKYQDIYISYFKKDHWTSAKKFPILNSRYNDETPYISKDGSTIIFASDRDGSKEMRRNKKGQVKVSFDLYYSKREGNSWSKPRPLPGNVNTIHHERAPSIGINNKEIYFSRWEFGNILNAAVYRATIKKGKYYVKNKLPAIINSNHQEVAFVPDNHNSGFYFSSKRRAKKITDHSKKNSHNIENLEIWNIQYIPYRNGEFGTPAELPGPINSYSNEAYFSIHNNTIFFCSNRNVAERRFDIYTETLPGTQKLQIKVSDASNNKPLQAKVSLEIITNNKNNTKEINTDKTGNMELTYKNIPNKVKLYIEKKGYLPYSKDLLISDILTSPIDIRLRLEREKLFTIRSIYFDSNSNKIKKESFFFLKNFIRYLKRYPHKRIAITGHTDLHGTDKYNQELSVQRAKAVKNYLKKYGIKKTRLKIYGAGKSQPVVSTKGAISDALNRRTEFNLIDGND